ncbi:hypothetical protein [Bartonella rattaustraliani]|uniref:hypothetical protein n=1 Tax=Bartonella rattaustraliani TaxID=481139 RepID=UPI00037756E7|nr:hypothetical protein [Bartonella rattaustraliani]
MQLTPFYQCSLRRGLQDFYEKFLKSLIRRGMLAANCSLASNFALLIVVAFYLAQPNQVAAFVFIITAFLLIRENLSNAFLAFTGFK